MFRCLSLLALAVLLTACGGSAAVPTAAPTSAPTQAVAVVSTPERTATTAASNTAVPPTDIPPTDIPPTDIPPTDIPPTDIPPTDIPPTETPASTYLAVIPESFDGNGVPVLGLPDAPVVFMDYSDFL